MLIANEGALTELRRFGAVLASWRRPAASAIRKALNEVGRFIFVELGEPERPIVAVDGSCQRFGASYPYFITLIQAVALPLWTGAQPVVAHRLFSPLLPGERELLEAQQEGDQPREVAAELRVKQLMAELELEVGREAVTRTNEGLILLDGGFVHFRARAAEAFARLASAAKKSGVLLVGVIEEVSSRLLSEAVAALWPQESPPYDREILYGCLGVGEAFLLEPQVRKDPEVGTIFARFGMHPQPVAFDFLVEQEERVFASLGLLRALTPRDGRGVPAPVDIADRYVRLTASEVEQLVASAVPAELREVFLTAHRLRRVL